MSVIFVILSFVLLCLILVHINLHQKKKELYNYIESVNKTLMLRHKKIAKLINMLDENEITNDIRILNENIVKQMQKGELLPSQFVKVEVLLEEKMQNLLKSYHGQKLSDDIDDAIESYKKIQKRLEKNKIKYNKMIAEFFEACDIQPATLYTAFENIDTDFPKLSAISE